MTRPWFPETPKASPVVVGIDPGLDGAVAFMCPSGTIKCISLAPVIQGSKRRSMDAPAMVTLLRHHRVSLAVIEAVHGGPVGGRMKGNSGMFNFGMGYGVWLGILAALKLPHELVSPQTWKADILKGTAKDKAAAIDFCRRRFPETSLKASPRCRVEHDGIADALCLAEYARRRIVGSTGGTS